LKVAYWPGCVSRGFTPELHGSMARIAPLLDIELVALDRASCCGAGVIAEHSQELADTLNARTFALAQQADGAALMMNICSTCQGAQAECQERLDANAEYRAHINETLAAEGLSYEKGLTNKNFLWLLVEEFGLDELRRRVQRPLTDLRVGRELDMPVLHLPQLVGLALGLAPGELGLGRHVVKPTSVIDWTTAVVAGVGEAPAGG
jgi:succinate dehydrogenase / fumarate reductase cytochrome b subunit